MADQASILIVDDELHLRELLKLLLTHQGYAVKAVADGDSALAMLRDESFDLVLSDLRMSPMDGLTLLGHVLALPDPPPLVMMTATRSPDTIATVLGKGAAGYVIKPFEVKELIATVARIVAPS